ncbi:MAG: hypothetical protein FWB78_04140 [Treponema sp.]|nr:hypothetical protein [Treponema sp.]
MKKSFNFFGIIAIVAMIGLSVTACDQANDPGPSQWTVALIQNHTATDNTTVASFIHTNGNQFPANVANPGARSGWTFTGYWTARSGGTQYFGADGTRTAVADDPRTLNNDLRLYAQWSQDEVQQPGNITWTASAYGSPTTTAINFTFSAEPTGLVASDITIASASGSATRGALTGTGTTRSLVVTGVSAGTVSVSINRDGIASGPQTVTLVVYEVVPTDITWNATAYGDPTTTAINFTFSAEPTGLVASDITLASASGSATRGALTGTGTTRSLAVTSVSAGTVSVSINRDGIASGPQTVTLVMPPPPQPDILTVIDIGPIPGIAASGPATFTLGTTYDNEFVDLRMSNRSDDWHAMDIQFPALITAGYLTATGTYTVRVTGRGGEFATGQFMIQGIQPGHNWGSLVSLAEDQPFTITRNFTMQAGPQPWAGDPRWAAARLTTDDVGENSDIIFTSIEIVSVPGNEVVWSLAEVVIVEDVPDITWVATPAGNPTTTNINFTFSADPGALAASDITINSLTGSATRGNLTGSGTTRALSVSNVSAGTVSVSINRDGIANEPRTVMLIAAVLPPPADITWTARAAGSPTTTRIEIDFNASVATLLASDITITPITGSATRGALTGSGNWRDLAVSNVSAGTVSISINRDGIASGPQTITLVAAAAPPPAITWTASPASGTPTPSITFNFQGAPTGLLATDITINPGTGSATRGALTGTGNTRTLAISNISAGTVSISINRDGIASGPQTITLVAPAAPPANITWTARAAGSPTTTRIEIDFNASVATLLASDITITPITGSATRGALTGSGNWRDLAVSNVSAGTVSISINRDGIASAPQTVTLVAAAPVITWSASPSGNPTNAINFTFSANPVGLTASDITISPAGGAATRGTLTGSGNTRTLAISNVSAGIVWVGINMAGIEITERMVTLTAAAPPANIAWTAMPASGTITPSITFGFLGDPGALTAAQITITPGTGSATRGALSGSGLTRTLTLTNVTAGTVNISINRAGIIPGPVQVTLSGGAAPPTTGPRITVTGIPAQFNGRLAQVVLQQTGATRTTTTVMITSGSVTMALPADQIIAGNFSAHLTIFGPPLHQLFSAPSRPISGTANTNIPWRYFSP